MIECSRQTVVARGRLRVPAHQRIQHAQCTARTRCRRHWRIGLRTAQGGDAVAVAHRDPRRQCARTRGLHRLEAGAGAEVERRRGVGNDQGQALALGLEQLGVRASTARGQPPVDMTRIVTLRVLARLGVLHAAPAQVGQRVAVHAMPSAPCAAPTLHQRAQGDEFGQARRDARPGSHGLIDRRHRGTQGRGTRCSNSATSRSPSQPSAVAS